jgi:hypothetical protein
MIPVPRLERFPDLQAPSRSADTRPARPPEEAVRLRERCRTACAGQPRQCSITIHGDTRVEALLAVHAVAAYAVAFRHRIRQKATFRE